MKDTVQRLKGKRVLYDLVVRVNEQGEKVFIFKGSEYKTVRADKLAESDEVLVLRRHAFEPEVAEDGLGKPDPCRGCGQTMYWKDHPTTGTPHPFNADGTSHFGTCPEADKFRGRK